MSIPGALIGGGFSLVGDLIGANSAKKLQNDAQAWARKMYRHRYRMTMRDMAEAGLNPILAGEVGGGSTPSVGMAQNAMAGAGARAVSSAGSLLRAVVDAKATKAQTNAIIQGEAESRARTEGYYADARLKNAQQAAVMEQNPTIKETIKNQNAKMQSEIEANSARALRDRTDAGRINLPGGTSLPVGMFERMWDEYER